MDQLDKLETLVAIMDRLREPGGCPWDREQTYASLRSYLMEESFEALEALDRVDEDEGASLCEELGDVLLQIVFLSRLAKEQRRFTIDDVVRGISEKMVRRHPHVFGDAEAADADQVLEQWEAIKRREKGGAEVKRSVLAGVPVALPALLRAHRLGTKAARVGFDWERTEDVTAKIDEERDELRRAIDGGRPEEIEEELGDVLFALVNLARKLEVDPERALQGANRKFQRRFGWIEERLADEGGVDGKPLERLEALWNAAKREERGSAPEGT